MKRYFPIAAAALMLCLFGGNAMADGLSFAGTGTFTLGTGSWSGQAYINSGNAWWKIDSVASGATLTFFYIGGIFWQGSGDSLQFNSDGTVQGHFDLGSSTVWSRYSSFDFSCSTHPGGTFGYSLVDTFVTPEPSAMLLLGAGLLGIGLLRRKFKS